MPRVKQLSKKPPRQPKPPPPTPLPPSYPWPRETGTWINPNDPNIPAHSSDRWDRADTRYYNALLEIPMAPTRFLHSRTVRALGLQTDMNTVLQSLGLDDFAYTSHSLYDDLARQALASCHITYDDPEYPCFENASFAFFANGVKYGLSLDKFSEVLMLDNEPTGLSFPKTFPPTRPFWGLIAVGDFKSRTANQSLIRNPVLRILAKTLSNLIFAKESTARVTNGELQFIYAGVEDQIKESELRIPSATVKTNPAATLAQMLVEKKSRVLAKGTKVTERCGSLFTPLFKECVVDLSPYTENATHEFIDVPYLIHCGILRDETTYAFQDKQGNALFCSLPNEAITTLSNTENIKFEPAPTFLCEDPKAVPPPQPEHMDIPEDVAADEFDLDPFTDVTDDAAYRQWMVASTRKNNSLLKRILRKLTGGCLNTPQTQERPAQHGFTTPTGGAGSSAAGERLGRNRRNAAQSDSDETE